MVRYSKSAFKHGFGEMDIKHAVMNVIYDEVLDEMNDKHLLIGFDGNGKLLEILYNILDDDTIHVFHVMKCRDAFISLLKRA